MKYIVSFRSLWTLLLVWIVCDLLMAAFGKFLPEILQFDGIASLKRDAWIPFFIIAAWFVCRERTPSSGSEDR